MLDESYSLTSTLTYLGAPTNPKLIVLLNSIEVVKRSIIGVLPDIEVEYERLVSGEH